MAQKLSYAAFLCLSIVMIVLALVRLIGSVATTKTTNRGTSPIWGTFWGMLEACIAVIMASFYTFRSAAAKGNGANQGVAAARVHPGERRPSSLWSRLLSTLRFRSRYHRSPSATGDELELGASRGNGGGGEPRHEGGLGQKHLISTLNPIRPTLTFSRLGTLFGSAGRTQLASEASLVTRGTIDVVTEFDLRELDYHEVRKQETAPRSGSAGFP